MADFVKLLPMLNSLAEQSPGFVWRLKTSDQTTADVAEFPDALMIVNLSVWKDIQSLKSYFKTPLHQKAFCNRHRWFEPTALRQGVLWWMDSCSLPTIAEGKRRLDRLNQLGETGQAFSFSRLFPSPSAA
jgi:hypothetical protein